MRTLPIGWYIKAISAGRDLVSNRLEAEILVCKLFLDKVHMANSGGVMACFTETRLAPLVFTGVNALGTI